MLPAWLPDTVTPDLDRALHYTLLWGLEAVALRTLGGRGDRVPHVNEAKLKRRLAEHDVRVAAVDPGLFEVPAMARAAWMNDLALLEEAAAFSRRIGGWAVIVGGLPDLETSEAAEALRRAGDAAARHGQALAVRNEGAGRTTGRELAAVLAAAGHPAVGACWDPAGARAAGEGPEAGLDALGGRVGVVVVRWADLGEDGRPDRVAWAPLLRGLRARGFDGPLVLDLRGATPKEGLRAATALLYLVREAERA